MGCDATTLLGYTRNYAYGKTLREFSVCLGNRDSINVFVVKNRLRFADGKLYSGQAMVHAPLYGSYAPTVIMAANLFSGGGTLLSHEVGHILGFKHTSSYTQVGGTPISWWRLPVCGEIVSYPHFYIKDSLSLERDSLHDEYPGRQNIMGYANIYSLLGERLLIGDYEEPFRKITACWMHLSFQQRTSSAIPLGDERD